MNKNPTHPIVIKTSLLSSAIPAFAFIATVLCVTGLASAQTLQLRYTFEDGPGTTTTNDPSSAIYPVPLNMVSGAYPGTPVDLHGAAGSGVQNQGHSLNMTTNSPAGNTGTQYYAATTANTTLGTGLGLVSNFTATVWFKMKSLVTNNVNNAARFFFLGTNGVTGNGGGNTIGMNINTGNSTFNNFPHNNIQLILNGATVPCPVYYDFPTNVWLFVAMTYDIGSGNACVYYGSEASPAKLFTVRTVANALENFGTSASLSIGNQLAGNRSFQGSIDEFRFYTGTASASTIESIRQSSTPLAVTGLAPDGSILQGGTNVLTFTATSASGVNASGIQVLVNGTDVSLSPATTYTPTAGGQIVTYTNLPVNPTLISQSILDGVNVAIKVTDLGGIVTSNFYVYDAFSPQNFTWECEDYDFGGGKFIDNPVYSFVGPDTNTYYQEQVTFGTDPSYVNITDANDNGNLSGTNRVYRDPGGNVETEYSLGSGNNGGQSISELMRQKVLDAYAVTNTTRDVNVGYFDGGTGSGLPNWMNYTRTYPAGNYNVYLRVANGLGSGIGTGATSDSFDKVTNGWGTSSQSISNIGTFRYNNTGGWDTFAWVPLTDANNNLLPLSVAGTNTLRLTAGAAGGGNVNFLMLVPANTNLPVISGVYPNGTNMFQPASALTFTASSPAGYTINPASISVNLTAQTLLGSVTVTNLTTANGGLVVTGTSSSRNVSATLATNNIFTAVINVTDVNGSRATTTVSFQDLIPNYSWEAPDYDYNGGSALSDPIPVHGYSGLSGSAEIDFHYANTPPVGNTYRDSTIVGVENNSDTPQRLIIITNNAQPYDIGYYNAGNWLNYTRAFPAGPWNIYCRLADGSTTGAGGGVTLAQVTGGLTTTNQTNVNLGTISVTPTGGWQTYVWQPLRDVNGNLVKFAGGTTETLKATATGSQNVFFYALFPADTNQPVIANLSPNGTSMFQRTNNLSFNVSSPAGINTNNIVVTLNGVVVSNLVFTGSSTSWNVSYPLLLDQPYTVSIFVTDAHGNTTSASASFDTFSQTFYTWEGEDFDYSGGQFFDNPQTNAYFGLPAMTDVDTHQNNFNAAAPYLYRTNSAGLPGEGNGMATEINGDVKRAQYLGGDTDYSMGYFSGGTFTNASWANYTRHYPTGSYNVYGRLASGGGATTATLSQVTSGWGTTNQTTDLLGNFNVPNTGWESYTFVPLRDNSGNLVTLTFTGSTNTLQIQNPPGSASDINVNFFMLVPGGPFAATATLGGGNINISFPTLSPLVYQLVFKNSLTDPTWTPIGNSLVGNGLTQSFSQPASGTKRFYSVQRQ
jgi:hypothetical protein